MNKMVAIIGVLFVSLIMIRIEFFKMKENKSKREIYSFILLLGIGIGLNTMISLDIKFPHLLDWLIIVFKPISQLVFNGPS